MLELMIIRSFISNMISPNKVSLPKDLVSNSFLDVLSKKVANIGKEICALK